jgi:biotin transporter BioY
VTTIQFVVTAICGVGAVVLVLLGVYWLGARAGTRAAAREMLEQELLSILGDDRVDLDVTYDEDDDDGGVAVLR